MMLKLLKALVACAVLAAVFGAGYLTRVPPTAPAPAARTVLYYVDPMHPSYTSDKPGIAPDCGMTLEPVYADQAAAPRDAPAGALRISPERQALIGVRFATVESGTATRTIRTVGKVAVDETRVGHVHTRIDGWIEQVYVDFTGDIVKQGEPMLTIYSPEMLASQEELLLAARARDVMPSLLDAARRRLQLWQLSEDQIAQVLASGQPVRSITVEAPMSGFITQRNAFPNQRVTPESDLYTITDLSRVWIVADVFESDIAAIKLGDPAYVTFATGGAPSLGARVNYIQPEVDPATRTLKVRLDAPNPGLRMKPEMYVNVEFGTVTPAQITIPAEAVLDAGDHQTVFVDLGGGYLEPRDVVVGESLGQRVTVVRGLTAGERIVASGTFLIDSEAALQAAARSMGAPPEERAADPAPPGAAPITPAPAGAAHTGHDHD